MKNICILGSGIKSIAHLSYESQLYIKKADVVLYLLNEPIMEEYIKENSNISYDLSKIYYSTENRQECYQKIVDFVIGTIDEYENICTIFYGHPLFCVNPAQKIIELASKKDINIISCPAISSIDCMFSDLNIDPAEYGMQIYMAQDLLNREINISTKSYLTILQAGFINEKGHVHKTINREFDSLKSYLRKFYTPNQTCIIYEATLYEGVNSIIQSVILDDLSKDMISSLTTLILPPRLS